MSKNSPLEELSPRATQFRTTPARPTGDGPLRYATAGVVGVIAVLYLLIGVEAITVVEDQAASGPVPPFIAGGLFAMLAVLLLVTTSRVVLVAGALLQVAVLSIYVVVAGGRTPAYEAWGLGMKAVQIGLLVALLTMLVRRSRPLQERPESPRPN